LSLWCIRVPNLCHKSPPTKIKTAFLTFLLNQQILNWCYQYVIDISLTSRYVSFCWVLMIIMIILRQSDNKAANCMMHNTKTDRLTCFHLTSRNVVEDRYHFHSHQNLLQHPTYAIHIHKPINTVPKLVTSLQIS